MNEEFKCGGKWWLPDNPEGKIRGTLKFAHDEGGILDLKGNFGDIEDISEFLEVVLGQNYLTLIAKILCHSPIANKAISLLSSLFCLINQPNLLLSAEKPDSLKFLLKYLFKNL